MAALMLGLLIVFALGACSADEGSGDPEVVGNYNDNFGGSHTISRTFRITLGALGN